MKPFVFKIETALILFGEFGTFYVNWSNSEKEN